MSKEPIIEIPIKWVKRLKFYTAKVKEMSKTEDTNNLLIEVGALLGYLESLEDLT